MTLPGLQVRLSQFAVWQGIQSWRDLREAPVGWTQGFVRCGHCGRRWMLVRPVGDMLDICRGCGHWVRV